MRRPSLVSAVVVLAAYALGQTTPDDPCTKIAGRTFFLPADARACFKSFPFNETLKQNVLNNVARVFDFFTFEAYYPNPPFPFQDSQVDIRRELARMNATIYATDYDFNIDLYKFTTRLNDGHTRWFPNCYTSTQNVLPAPVVTLLVAGRESIFIAPDSVDFISLLGSEYTSQLDALGFDWRRLAGARVVEIDDQRPDDYVRRIARTESGNFLDFGVRVNFAFSSYRISGTDYSQRLGDIAGPTLVERDHLKFKLVLANSFRTETVTVPFVTVFTGTPFTNKTSYWANNCAANAATNGRDFKDTTTVSRQQLRFGQAFIIDKGQASAVGLPNQNHPTLPPLHASGGVVKSYVLPDRKTGVIFVGSFAPSDFFQFQTDIVAIVERLKAARVTRILIDVTNNGGGYICLGVFLHTYLAGSDFGYGGFESTTRGNDLAVKIVDANIRLGLTSEYSYYTPDNWRYLNGTAMPPTQNYINPRLPFRVNGRDDPTSQRFQDNCPVWYVVPIPRTPPFPLKNIAIVGNGVCASTCAMFTTVMYERHRMAGNQVLEWSDLASEIKTADLENDPLAPPDLLVSGNFRHNWRTAWSYFDKNKPIAYLAEYPHVRYPYTLETYNNPQNLWIFAASKMFTPLGIGLDLPGLELNITLPMLG